MRRTKPILFTPEEHANITTNAAEGIFLASQGQTALETLQEVEQLRAENEALRARVARYEALYGVLEDEAPAQPVVPNPEFNVDTFYSQHLDLDD